MGDVSDYAKLTDVITVSTAVAELKDRTDSDADESHYRIRCDWTFTSNRPMKSVTSEEQILIVFVFIM